MIFILVTFGVLLVWTWMMQLTVWWMALVVAWIIVGTVWGVASALLSPVEEPYPDQSSYEDWLDQRPDAESRDYHYL